MEPSRKPNKIRVDKGSEFYNESIKSWLEKNAIEIYLTHMNKNMLLLKDLSEPYQKKNY